MATLDKRTAADGSISWRFRVRKHGYPTRTKSFSRKTDAQAQAHQHEAKIDRGLAIPSQDAAKRTLDQAIDRYLLDVLPHKLSAQLGETQRLYQAAQGQMAALQQELAAARAMLAQTQADSAHTEAALDTALATARTDTERARAKPTDVSQGTQRQIGALTKFIPRAAYYKDETGASQIFEQSELVERLRAQSMENPDQIDLEAAIALMGRAQEVKITWPV